MYQRRVEAFMLDADYYRSRADLCMELAHAGRMATPLCMRLISLADDYRARAKAAELNQPAGNNLARVGAAEPHPQPASLNGSTKPPRTAKSPKSVT